MMEFIAHWYNEQEVIHTDVEHIIAENATEATNVAYRRYNGNPPAALLFLEEVKR